MSNNRKEMLILALEWAAYFLTAAAFIGILVLLKCVIDPA